MLTSLLKKSWGDLKLRKSRTIFTILTICLAVASLSMFAVNPLMDMTMEDELKQANLYDLELTTQDLELDQEQMKGLENLENVDLMEGRAEFYTRYYKGARRADALIIGIEDFNDQKVNIVQKNSGNYPGVMELMADGGNARNDLFNKNSLHLITHDGSELNLTISGVGSSVSYPHSSWGVAVFYADLGTVHQLSNTTGVNILSFDLEKADKKAAENTILTVTKYLEDNTNFTAFTEMPSIIEEGDYPGKDEFQDNALLFYVLTFLTLFCAIFLIANTMNTIITEQRKEIAQMKAVGATKWQIIKSYMLTGFLMGGAGSFTGATMGVFIAHWFLTFIATTFYGIVPPFNIHWPTVIITFVAGIAITMLATLPAMIRALKVTVREGLEGGGISANYGKGIADKLLLKTGWMPRTAQMGIRNMARKKGRTISSFLQVALAVGMFLGIVAVGFSLSEAVSDEYENFSIDIITSGQTEGAKPLTKANQKDLESIDGVKIAEPFMLVQNQVKDEGVYLFGFPHDTIAFNHKRTVYAGRWFNEKEENSNATVVVLAKQIAKVSGVKVGDELKMDTPTGPYTFKVIGLTDSQMMNGMSGYAPFTTVQHIMKWDDVVNGFSIQTETQDHAIIDRVATDIEDTLMAQGHVVVNEIWYVAEEENLKSNQMMINLMAAVGTLIVLITLIGLMSAITMNVLERTKEIGMMRCIGSRARDIRRVFGTEGLFMAFTGWLLGVPAGYGVGKFLVWMIDYIFGVTMPFLFPVEYVALSLLITLVVTMVIMQLPLHRAVKLKPGDALRYG